VLRRRSPIAGAQQRDLEACSRNVAEGFIREMAAELRVIGHWISRSRCRRFVMPSMNAPIPFEDDFSRVVNHLKNAIVGESISRFAASSSGDFTKLWREIEEEVRHVTFETHEIPIRVLLGFMLLAEARAHWGKLVNEAFPFLELESLPPSDVPNFLKTSRRKVVLILGKDTEEGLDRLRRIRNVVEGQGYQCLLIKDLPEHSEMGLVGKALFTALAARFTIMENSTPSGHLYELPFVRMAECVIVLLQEEGMGATWMTEDMVSKHPLLRKFTYTSDTCELIVRDAIIWAETRIADNIKTNIGAWPWAQDKRGV
jgi:hypothetical protein